MIDGDELKIYISTTFCDTCKRDKGVCSSCEFDDVFVAIDNAPTIDAEPVVRCKDCVYFKKCITDFMGDTVELNACSYNNHGTNEDDYCSNGERREP